MASARHPTREWTHSEAREYASMLDLANDAIIVLEPDGIVSFWNSGAERLYGWRKAEALGRNSHQLLKTFFPVPLEEIKVAVRDKGEWQGELLHTTKRGEHIIVASRWTPRYGQRGELIGTFEINRDITQQKHAQLALQEADQRLQLALAAANAWYWEYDVRTKRLVRSRDVSDAYGLPAGTLGDRVEALEQYVHPEDRPRIQPEIRAAAAEGREFSIEYRIIWPDNSVHWLWLRGRAVMEDSQPVRLIGITMDVTDRKRAEELLITSERLAATGRQAAAIAHEIRNPLDAIGGSLYLLEREISSERARNNIETIRGQLDHVANIVQHTLGMHRDSRAATLANICDIAADVLTFYGHAARQKHVTLERRYEQPCNAYVHASELRQVISNLVANAISAVAPQGRIIVHVKSSGGGAGWKRRGVRVTVADNGSGIAPEMRARMFQAFATTKGEQGTGLGLWVSKRLVEQHGGRLRFRTSTGERHGTVFQVFVETSEQ
jgi:PAS domain S-box-containing protein